MAFSSGSGPLRSFFICIAFLGCWSCFITWSGGHKTGIESQTRTADLRLLRVASHGFYKEPTRHQQIVVLTILRVLSRVKSHKRSWWSTFLVPGIVITKMPNLYNAAQFFSYIIIITVFVKPLGGYLERVFAGQRTMLDRFCLPVERLIYRITGTDPAIEMMII